MVQHVDARRGEEVKEAVVEESDEEVRELTLSDFKEDCAVRALCGMSPIAEMDRQQPHIAAQSPQDIVKAKAKATPTPLSKEKAIKHLKNAEEAKLKPAMKVLVKAELSPEQRVEVVESLARWSTTTNRVALIGLSAKLITYLRLFAEVVPESDSRVTELLVDVALRVANTNNMLECDERMRAVKMLMAYAVARAGAPTFIKKWTELLKQTERTLHKTLAKWVEQWSINGNGKLEWERFFNEHCPLRPFKMISDEQSSQIVIEQSEQPKVVETVVVWNGNGARARWADKAELKQVFKATDPDVLCFLEGKTDSENLVKLPLFREWATKSKLSQINCYWSTKDGKKGFGNEGIILFSKVPCVVKYGLGDKELDAQARVMTAEFSDCIMLFTYNPQGGFSEQSLAFRSKWEAALQKYIQSVSLDALVKQKKMIWGGDLNVNPEDSDWSMKAFDRIRNRIPKGTLPAGCRKEDQKAYREMVQMMGGVNLAEHFKKQTFRTCFPSEDYLRKNFGQRIDHVIAQESLLQSESELRITAFDTLIGFGASRKGSSDHCPLWFKLERGHEQPVLSIREQPPEVKMDPDTLVEIGMLMPPVLLRVEPEEFKDVEPTPEFVVTVRNEHPEDEWEEIACAAFEQHPYLDASSDEECEEDDDDEWEVPVCNTSENHAFEDCSSPIINCQAYGEASSESVAAKILVDSGSTLDLISGRMARKLQSLGHELIETTNNVKIKVANGKRSTLKQALKLNLILQGEHTDPVQWLVLEDLPFDMILGSRTCKKWKSKIDWGKSKFSLTPKDKKIQLNWNIYRGQHWRKPVVLMAAETVTIPPHSQVIIGVHNSFNESEGYSCKTGLVTPTREEVIISQKFSIAYMYGEGVDRVVAANATDAPLVIAKGTAVAEFHPRPEDCFKREKVAEFRTHPQGAPKWECKEPDVKDTSPRS